MAFSSPITAVTGASFTAAQFNTSVRDNLNAIWVGTSAGDIDYYTSSSAKTRLAFVAGGVLYGSTSSAPAWLARPASVTSFLISGTTGVPSYASKGLMKAANTVDFAPAGQAIGSSGFSDITGATTNIVLPAGNTYTIEITAVIDGYCNTAGASFIVAGNVGGSGDSGATNLFNGGATLTRNEAEPYIYLSTGVAAGTVTVKLVATVSGGAGSVYSGRMIVKAYTE